MLQACNDHDDDTGKVTDPIVDDDNSGDDDGGERTDTSMDLDVTPVKRDKCLMPFA